MVLWKDIEEQESCENCPLLENEICPGGWRCYGNEPIEPPCCSFEGDTDLDKWVENYFDSQLKREEWEDRRIREESKKKERAKKAANTRRAMRWYCRDEIDTLKRTQKVLQAQKSAKDFALSFAEATNFANEMFRYKKRVEANPELSEEVRRLEAEVSAAKERYNAKRKEFYAKRKKEDHHV